MVIPAQHESDEIGSVVMRSPTASLAGTMHCRQKHHESCDLLEWLVDDASCVGMTDCASIVE